MKMETGDNIELSKKPYGVTGVIKLPFGSSPVMVVLHFALSFIYATMPTALMALTTANFVDTVIAILSGTKGRNEVYLPLVLLLMVLGLFTTLPSLSQLINNRIRLSFQLKIKPVFVRVHAALDFRYIENTESQELITRVTNDPVASVMSGFDGFTQLIRIVTVIVSIIGLIFSQVIWAAFVVLAFSVPLFWLSMWAGRKNYQARKDAEKFNRRTEYLGEVLTGRDGVDERTLFSFGERVIKKWYEQYEAGRKLQVKVNLRTFLIIKGSSLSLALISILIALTLIGPVVSGVLSAGMFMGIVAAVFASIHPLGWEMTGAVDNISKAREYMKDINLFMELSGSDETLCEPSSGQPEVSSLEFRDVRFKYPTSDGYALSGITFRLEKGKHYAFVGKNGAGKTTVTKLLTGLYSEYEGEIFINEKELREYPTGELKSMFSVVYQDFAKYYVSLSDNIALGDASKVYDLGQVKEAASLSGLDETINKLKDGIDTALGKIIEDGQDISGGEWQKVAIARSLYSNASVKLLDEPTASLDPIGESRVYEEFEKLMKGKTTVFISHRLGSTKLADEIIVIDEGRVTERGTHESLMGSGGLYREMFESQRSWYQ